ncbi:MAG: hypothetical protein ACI4I6_07560 [Hominimerdicola sp.]
MTEDLKTIQTARQSIKGSLKDFSAVYAENAGENCAEKIRSAIDGQLRIAKQLANLEGFYSHTKPENADENAVKAYKKSMDKE